MAWGAFYTRAGPPGLGLRQQPPRPLRMRQFLRTLVEIRRGELAITLLMSLNYYLVLVTYYFLKPARDSLFLVEIGPGQLPVVFMLIAVVATPVTA